MIIASAAGEIRSAVDLMAAMDRLESTSGVRPDRIYMLGDYRQEMHDALFRDTYQKDPPKIGLLDRFEVGGIDVREFQIVGQP